MHKENGFELQNSLYMFKPIRNHLNCGIKWKNQKEISERLFHHGLHITTGISQGNALEQE
jgi:hypothetical protein